MKEIWKDIVGYEGLYQVSSLGNVRSLDRYVRNTLKSERLVKGQLLRPAVSTSGYLQVGLHKEGVSKHNQLHQLVAKAFLEHVPNRNKTCIDHINGNKFDNRLENLQEISVRENSSKDKMGFTSDYIGVCWFKRKKKWKAGIKINGKSIHLGYFHVELEASEAYQKRLTEYLETGM